MKPASERHPPRLYGKDMPCPKEWQEYIGQRIPSYLVYRGNYDLVSNLQSDLQPLSLMIYVGVEDTYTPGKYLIIDIIVILIMIMGCVGHKDICGSLGHNIMVAADEGAYAVWFMMHSKDQQKVEQFWADKGMYYHNNPNNSCS